MIVLTQVIYTRNLAFTYSNSPKLGTTVIPNPFLLLDKSINRDAAIIDGHFHCAALKGMKRSAAYGLICGVDFRQGPAPVTAKDNPIRPAPLGQTRRVAFAAAVVWGQKHVAVH